MTVLLTELAQATAAILAHSLEGVTVGQAAAMLTEADIDVEHPQRLRMLHRFLIRHPRHSPPRSRSLRRCSSAWHRRCTGTVTRACRCSAAPAAEPATGE
jgi:hypothetical protein